jgi:hypothetical protein
MLRVSPEEIQNINIREVVRDPDLQWFVNRTLSSTESIEGEVGGSSI